MNPNGRKCGIVVLMGVRWHFTPAPWTSLGNKWHPREGRLWFWQVSIELKKLIYLIHYLALPDSLGSYAHESTSTWAMATLLAAERSLFFPWPECENSPKWPVVETNPGTAGKNSPANPCNSTGKSRLPWLSPESTTNFSPQWDVRLNTALLLAASGSVGFAIKWRLPGLWLAMPAGKNLVKKTFYFMYCVYTAWILKASQFIYSGVIPL